MSEEKTLIRRENLKQYNYKTIEGKERSGIQETETSLLLAVYARLLQSCVLSNVNVRPRQADVFGFGVAAAESTASRVALEPRTQCRAQLTLPSFPW